MEGRWFLHFKSDGSIQIGLWSVDESRALKFHYDDEGAPHVDLSDVFDGDPKWRWIGSFTLEIKNNETTHRFTLVPDYQATNPDLADNVIKFFEVGGRGRGFEIGFLSRYKADFNASMQYR